MISSRQRALLPMLAPAALLALLGACGDGGDAVPVRDSALDRDLTLATGPAVVPPLTDSLTLGDTAMAPRTPPAPVETPAPVRAPARRAPTRAASTPAPQTVAERPAPAPVAPAAEPVVAPAAEPAPVEAPGPALARGTLLAGTTGSRLCSTTNRPGDRLVATLAADVTGPDGLRLPAGTGMVLEVARISPEGQVELMARGVSLNGTFHPIIADVTVGASAVERQSVAGTTDSKGKAVKGAIAGAILGQILGRDTRGTVIGAATGAAAGAAMGQLSKKSEVCLPAGAPVSVRLADALTVR